MKLSEEIAAAAAHRSTPTDTRKRYEAWAMLARRLEIQLDQTAERLDAVCSPNREPNLPGYVIDGVEES